MLRPDPKRIAALVSSFGADAVVLLHMVAKADPATPVAADEDPRAGRWRAQPKEECGIHFVKGQPICKHSQETAA